MLQYPLFQFPLTPSDIASSLDSQSRISRQAVNTHASCNPLTDHNRWATLRASKLDIVERDVGTDCVWRANQRGNFAAILARTAPCEFGKTDVGHVYAGWVLGACCLVEC